VDNLVAIAYRTGHCGSFLNSLLILSNEIQKFSEEKITYEESTAHKNNEHWFKKLHSYWDATEINNTTFETFLTDKSKLALKSKKLIIFRCHPNLAKKLSYIKNFRVLYINIEKGTENIFDRFAYEKYYKKEDDSFYFHLHPDGQQTKLKKWPFKWKYKKLNDQIRRKVLLWHLRHEFASYEDCKKELNNNIFKVNIKKILNNNYNHYTEICKFLKITAIKNSNFTNLVNNYMSYQWKRF